MLLFLALSPSIVHAGDEEVLLTSDRQKFIFPLDNEALVPVTISNSLKEDITGTLTVKIYDSPGIGSAASYQRKAMTAFSGDNTIYVPAGRSGEEKTILMDIAFEYGINQVYRPILSGIVVVFTDSEAQVVPESDLKAVSSKTEIQPSRTPADSYRYNGNDLTCLTEEYPDSSALQKTLLEEQIEDEFIRQRLLSTILNDTLFKSENKTLSYLNFTLSRIYTEGTDYNKGSFAWNYHTPERDRVVLVSGVIEDGKIAYIVEKINNSVLLPPEFKENATLDKMLSDLGSEGFVPAETAINISPKSKRIEIALTRGVYGASVVGESEHGNITFLDMEKEKSLPFYVLPLIIIVLAVINASAIYIYSSLRAESGERNKTAEPLVRDFNSPALRMLDGSEELFRQGRRKEAACCAARALREWISAEFFSGEELPDGRCTEFLASKGEDYQKTAIILGSTEISRYGGGSIPDDEFAEMIETFRSLIGSRAGCDK